MKGLVLALLAALYVAAPGEAKQIAIGARIPGAPQNPSLIDAYGQAVGRAPAIVSWYREWGQTVFDRYSLQPVASRGAMPMITWEPSVPGWRRGQRSSILRTIARGRADRYLRAQARAARRWGRPVMVRFAPEMNGGWNPWGVRTPGNRASTFIAAWRHVVTVFRQAGARNVRWVWCPNVDDDGALPFKQLFPGDRYVDWVGLDGYNWGGSWPWQSFSSIFRHSYRNVVLMSRRPIMVAETGAGERGGSKARWITNTFRRELPRFTRIRALVWFNGFGETGADFRFNSSPASARAFSAAVRQVRYSVRGSWLVTRAVSR